MNAPKPSRRQILVGIGAISMRQSIRATTPAEAAPPANSSKRSCLLIRSRGAAGQGRRGEAGLEPS